MTSFTLMQYMAFFVVPISTLLLNYGLCMLGARIKEDLDKYKSLSERICLFLGMIWVATLQFALFYTAISILLKVSNS